MDAHSNVLKAFKVFSLIREWFWSHFAELHLRTSLKLGCFGAHQTRCHYQLIILLQAQSLVKQTVSRGMCVLCFSGVWEVGVIGRA